MTIYQKNFQFSPLGTQRPTSYPNPKPNPNPSPQEFKVILRDSVSQVLSRNASFDFSMTFQFIHFQNDLVLTILRSF
jgi:hypothetical protein